MAELEETWTEKSFYDRPLSLWDREVESEEDILLLDIFTAASMGCSQRVDDIIKKDKTAVNAKNKGSWTALMYAAYYGHSEVVNILLEANVSVHQRNNTGCNSLMLAVMNGYESIVQQLIKAGSILETRDDCDWTALFHAINCGHLSVIVTLLRYKANPNSCVRETGMTPLMYAAQLGNAAMVKTLLKGGAVTTLTTHQGHTAARIAEDAGNKELAEIIVKWSLQGVNGPSLFDGQAALEVRFAQSPRNRGNSVPSLDNTNVIPTNLETLLNQLGLSSYMSVFKEQDVDLQVFLTLTDQDLKECGIQKLGPRRKMTSAIARWHSNAPLRSGVECAYADKLEVEMQELGVKLTEAVQSKEQAKARVNQEHDLRVVTEGWVIEARGRLQEGHQISQVLMDQLSVLHHCVSLLSGQYSHVQPTLVSTLVDSLNVISVQADAINRLTDPSVPRGSSNLLSPRKQVYPGSHPNTPR